MFNLLNLVVTKTQLQLLLQIIYRPEVTLRDYKLWMISLDSEGVNNTVNNLKQAQQQ